ncbi:DNA polymerase I B- chloroplastic/mitochondrial [Striga hermonthica]|uniref:DNA-directed DNA polymerase n=1 Tax=Striga hermonthica TaxID=68872 RepID=A0A9N7R521_STRHE|nr:DNA polymerase I B- chloroplastic/mitochondrial [Striga hermonthica]
MGFSAPATPFRPSSFSPPYFWLCRSYTRLYSFSSWSRVFCRLEDRVRPTGSGLNDDLVVQKQRKSYSTHYERKGGRVTNWSYPQLKGPVVSSEEDCNEVVNANFSPLHTATDWGVAAGVQSFKRKCYVERVKVNANLQTLPEEEIAGRLGHGSQKRYERKGEGGSNMAVGSLMTKPTCPNGLENKGYGDSIAGENNVNGIIESVSADEKANLSDAVGENVNQERTASESEIARERLSQVYDKVLVVDGISAAREVVRMLTTQYNHLIHACDTEVANIDAKEETPVDHGEIICFSIYSGPQADFGNGKSCVWVDVLDGGGRDIIKEFAPFFEDPTIKKVWHNYSFDNHVIENYGLKVSGFYADTMHMARLWNSSRRMEGGYSLEALTGDRTVMKDAKSGHDLMDVGKVSVKTIFGKKKMKKDGSEGKLVTIPPVEELQRTERKLWICYSALDSISTLRLYESLEKKLMREPWSVDGKYKGSMFQNYQRYLLPFGELLVKMETEGMLVNRLYLAEIEKVAKAEQQIAADRFRKWASKYCPDAKYMNVGSDTQLRQFLFSGIQNRKDPNEFLDEKEVKVPNVDNIIEEGKESPTKYHKIVLRKPDFVNINPDKYTASGWPSVSGDVLRSLAGKVSADFDFLDEENDEEQPENMSTKDSECHQANPISEIDTSACGEAYSAFGGGQAGIEACHAFAALCESCAIDSLLSNFIIPLQGNHISGKTGRIHCSINLNTETGRLSARRPNLQNQPALEKDRYKIRKAFVAAPGNSLIVADYGQLELRILAHLAECESMLDAFKAGGDFHSRTAMNMYPHIRAAVEQKEVLLEWHTQSGEDKPPVPLLKDTYASERRKAKMLNFSIAYGKTTVGLARDWKVSREEAQETVDLWYSDRQEVLKWQDDRKKQAHKYKHVYTLLGRACHFPLLKNASSAHRHHIERAAINIPVQGSAADVVMCAMLEISRNERLKELGWRLLLQVHDEVILEGPTESAEEAKAIVVHCMSYPFDGKNILRVDLSVDAKCAQNWYEAK